MNFELKFMAALEFVIKNMTLFLYYMLERKLYSSYIEIRGPERIFYL